jgi:hypothetical protein
MSGVPIRLVADGLLAALALCMVAMLAGRFARNLKNLARMEPAKGVRPAVTAGPFETPRATSLG